MFSSVAIGVGDVQLAVEDVVADVANAVIPALVNTALTAEDAADSALAGDLRIDIAVLHSCAGGVRRGVGDIALAGNAADKAARRFNLTGEGRSSSYRISPWSWTCHPQCRRHDLSP